MAFLDISSVSKSFGSVSILRDVDLAIDEGEFVVFVGPSGCGKSTLLRMISGLEEISAGTISIAGEVMNEVEPADRGAAMVFQSYALYPHMDVYENMAFGARLMGLDKAEVESRIAEASRMLRLEELLRRKPRELSGGQRQRVAIGRALVRKPEVFLLDEPLSNLDAALRSDVRLEIARLHHEIGGTMIYVTHDQVEAMTLADKIVVMNAGRIEQVGSPRELYETPANTFVATFIGSPRMTLVDVKRDGERLVMDGGGAIRVGALPEASALKLGLRHDAVRLARGDSGEGFSAQVVYTEYLGESAYVYVRLADGTLLSARTDPNDSFAPDAPVTVTVEPGAVHFFSAENGRRLAP